MIEALGAKVLKLVRVKIGADRHRRADDRHMETAHQRGGRCAGADARIGVLPGLSLSTGAWAEVEGPATVGRVQGEPAYRERGMPDMTCNGRRPTLGVLPICSYEAIHRAIEPADVEAVGVPMATAPLAMMRSPREKLADVIPIASSSNRLSISSRQSADLPSAPLTVTVR